MIDPQLYLVSLVSIGLAVGIPGYITMSRHWPGLIAGFDPARCLDVNQLTRSIGRIGVLLGISCIVGGVAIFVAPQYRTTIILALVVVIIGGAISSTAICTRLTRR